MLAMAAKKASSSQETKWGECNITTILIVVSWCPRVLRRGLGVRPSQCKKRVRPPCLTCICTNGRAREWCKWSEGQLVLFFFIYCLPCVRLDVSEFWRVRILACQNFDVSEFWTRTWAKDPPPRNAKEGEHSVLFLLSSASPNSGTPTRFNLVCILWDNKKDKIIRTIQIRTNPPLLMFIIRLPPIFWYRNIPTETSFGIGW